MSRLIKSTAVFAALAVSASVFAAPVYTAHAQQPVAAITVSYGDLNLDNPQGIDALFSRIDHASRKVCGARPAHIMNFVLTRYLACRDEVMAKTVKRIGIPAVSLAWADKRGDTIRTASR